MVKLTGDSTGRVAIYNGSTDAPFYDPKNNLSLVKFHTELDYPTIINTVNTGVTLPARAANGIYADTYSLFAHGRGGHPMILAEITSPFSTSLSGSVPVYMSSGGFARWVSIGANASHVVLHEQCVTYRTNPQPALGLNIRVYITDKLL